MKGEGVAVARKLDFAEDDPSLGEKEKEFRGNLHNEVAVARNHGVSDCRVLRNNDDWTDGYHERATSADDLIE